MSQEQCNSCGTSGSIYGKISSECHCYGLRTLGSDTQAVGGGLLPFNKKKKRKILSTLDILISVFIVTPLVVACWRGTWQLMDIYAVYFPPWESFLIGSLIHIIIGISQENFDGLVNKKHKSWVCDILACLFMKLYTIVLNGVTNMHWRGGWIIVEEYFGITHMENGEIKVENERGAVSFFAICLLIMFAMRCLRNLNSPPFEICLDYGDDMFLFPNMFKVKFGDFGLYKDMINQKKSSTELIYGNVGVQFLYVLLLISLSFAGSTKNQAQKIVTSPGLDSTTWLRQDYPRPFGKQGTYVPKSFMVPSSIELLARAFLHINPHKNQKISMLKKEEEIIVSNEEIYKLSANDEENKHLLRSLIFLRFRPSHPEEVSEKFSLYILDVIFSIGVVTNLGILVWRGLWLLVDFYFFPGEEVYSAWGSLFVGYVMVAIVFLLQSLMKKLCDNLSGIPRLLVADAYMIFAVVAVIHVWRGIWTLLNIYFLPENEELSCWISLWIPMAVLIIMGCSNSLLVRGVCLDCEEPDGTCVVFPCNYLKDIFDQEKYDTWFTIWTGISKNKKIEDLQKNMINYHIVNMNDGNDDSKNNNSKKSGIS